jgi:hypothetical protein
MPWTSDMNRWRVQKLSDPQFKRYDFWKSPFYYKYYCVLYSRREKFRAGESLERSGGNVHVTPKQDISLKLKLFSWNTALPLFRSVKKKLEFVIRSYWY